MLNAAVRQGLRSLSAMGIACCRTATTAAAIFRDDAGSMRMRRKKLRSVCNEPLTRRSVTDGMAHPSLLAQRPASTALRDPSSEVRLQIALGIGGQKAAALAMPLVVAMEDEKDETVLRELILALGRIGSPDAVQALIKWSQPAGRIFGRKPAALRLAAVEGLRLAGTPAAHGTLDGLADDGDREVRSAARAAVSELGRKRRG